jgi:hemerythrin
MILIEWDSSLILGVKQIDEHHEHLVSILNECYRTLMRHNQEQELQVVIDELRDYTHYHFETERKLMDDLGYAAANSHLAAHEKFTSSILEFQDRLQSGESLVAMDVLMFLKEWLVDHIQKTDRVFTTFLKQKGVE